MIKNVSHMYKEEQCKQNILLIKRYLEDVQALTLSSGEFRQSRKTGEPRPTLTMRYLFCLSLITKEFECPKVFPNLKQAQKFISRLLGNIIITL